MFFDIEQSIVDALNSVFTGSSLEGNIQPAISKNDIKTRPLRFPAVRVVFLGMDSAQDLGVPDREVVTRLKYGVLYYFRSFRDKDAQNIYPELLKIVDTLKNLQTPRGILQPENCSLVANDGYYAYLCEFSIETVI